jgi:hypothetical protein
MPRALAAGNCGPERHNMRRETSRGALSDPGVSAEADQADEECRRHLATKAGITGKVNLDSDPTNVTATATDSPLEVELADYYIGPSFINAKPGSTIHAELKNAGL